MYKITLVEDTIELSDSFVQLLHTFCASYVSEIKVANTFADAVALLSKEQPDILFMDIELDHGKTGFDLLRALDRHDFHLVVVTSHAHYALQAIKSSAVDFLLKPVDVDELMATFEKIEETQSSQSTLDIQLKALEANLSNSFNQKKKLVLRTAESIRVVNVSEIIRCEASSGYTTFYLESGEKIVVSKPLKEHDELLTGFGFFRPHKSHLINMEFFKSYEKRDGGYLVMSDQSIVPLSTRKKDPFLQLLESL